MRKIKTDFFFFLKKKMLPGSGNEKRNVKFLIWSSWPGYAMKEDRRLTLGIVDLILESSLNLTRKLNIRTSDEFRWPHSHMDRFDQNNLLSIGGSCSPNFHFHIVIIFFIFSLISLWEKNFRSGLSSCWRFFPQRESKSLGKQKNL